MNVEEEVTNLPIVREPDSSDLDNSEIALLPIRNQRVIHMYLTGGFTTQEIADALGYSKNYVKNLLCRKDIRDIIEKIQLDEDDLIRQSIKALRMKAMKKMSDLIDSSQDAIAYQAARDVLDRTGHKGVDKKEVNVNVTFEQQLKEIIGEESINIDDYSVIDIDV
jgi:hypothetical protein